MATIALVAAAPLQATSFWTASTVPGTPNSNDPNAVTLGLQFKSSVAGTVTGVRFYKNPYNTGTHTGQLWSSGGTLLASVTFTAETASGWQQANFASAVNIQANTTYVISYFAPEGNYADDSYYGWSSVNASPLSVVGSAPGVYAYGSGSMFPNLAWDASNYYVDLVFSAGSGSSPTYTISGSVSGASNVSISLSGAASKETTTSGSFSFSGLGDGTYLLSPSASGYTFSPATASVTVQGANVTGLGFTASQSVSHAVTLGWTASTSPNVTGYKVYRAGSSSGPFTLISGSAVSSTSYTDTSVVAGDTYFYVTTALNSSGLESGYSNVTSAVVP